MIKVESIHRINRESYYSVNNGEYNISNSGYWKLQRLVFHEPWREKTQVTVEQLLNSNNHDDKIVLEIYHKYFTNTIDKETVS